MTNDTVSSKEHKIQVDNLLLNIFIDNRTNISMHHLVSSLHTHSYVEIFSCKKGEIFIMTPKQQICLSAGEIAIVPSGIKHLRTPSVNSETEWTQIGFICAECTSQNTRNLYRKIAHVAESEKIIVYKDSGVFYDIIEGIKTSTNIDNEPSSIIGFLSELSKLANTIVEKGNQTKEKTKHTFKNIDRLFKLEYFINQEFMNPLTNKNIADELHIGERQLSRLVLNHYGTTLHALIVQKRISVATKLLEESTDSVENIALAVGFNNKMNFYREFKKLYNITPAQYRHRKTVD